jgi:tetratricopeptide (TPR) repeat protein/outer membrane protein assembly factor BamB
MRLVPAVTASVALSVALSVGLSAQPREPDPRGDTEGLRLPTDRKVAALLAAAQDYIRERDWVLAVRILQEILDRPEDVFIPEDLGANGKSRRVFVSARAEAERRIASLPKAGLEAYELKYGPAALDLLKAARKKKDPARFAEVVRRFLHTKAGPEALAELAGHHVGAKHFHRAAAAYRRLLDVRPLARWKPEELYRAAVAFRESGDGEHMVKMREALVPRVPPGGLRVGGKALGKKEIRKEFANVRWPEGWPLFRGNPARTNQAEGGAPLLTPRWEEPFRVGLTARGWIGRASDQLRKERRPLIPAFTPIVVPRGDGLVVCRDYRGLQARDLKTSKLRWRQPNRWGLGRILGSGREGFSDARQSRAYTDWLNEYFTQEMRPDVLFENTLVGSLSTDGLHVYAVMDLPIPPLSAPEVRAIGADLKAAIQRNELAAYSLVKDGALVWQLGGDYDKGPLIDHFFLGPPLPIDGELYVLTQKGDDLRLARLEPRRGKVLSVQPLVSGITPLEKDPGRRLRAVHLAAAGGILVCPTHAGVVFGIDLLTGKPAWAHRYAEGKAPKVGVPPVGAGRPGLRRIDWHDHWLASAPVIAGNRVILAAADAPEVRCLGLKDGKLLWKAGRREGDLYLGGVFNNRVLIVGKSRCRTLNLADGKEIWSLATGLPSGHGVGNGWHYFLPLREAAGTKAPEVCMIDVAKGKITSHVRSRKGEVPGNLTFHGKDVISLSAEGIAVYPQLAEVLREVNARLRKNPNDPAGLYEQGQLRLADGDLAGAVASLRKALDNDPPKEVLAKARERLFEALTDYLRTDYKAAHKHLKEYEKLCRLPEDRDERRRRLGLHFALVGEGERGQGRFREALEAYLKLAELGPSKEWITPREDPGRKVRREVWLQGQIDRLLREAPPRVRKELEKEIEKRLQKLRKDDEIDPVEDFASVLGPETGPGREARLMLAGRLIAAGRDVEADPLLQEVRGRKDDPARAARALHALAELHTRRGHLADAMYYYRLLARHYPNVKLPTGETGKGLLARLTTDKRFLPYLEEERRIPADRVAAREEIVTTAPSPEPYPLLHRGEALPSFRSHDLLFDPESPRLEFRDRTSRKATWRVRVPRTYFLSAMATLSGPTRFQAPYHTRGRLMVVSLLDHVVGIDAAAGRLLWEVSLLPEGTKIPDKAGGARITETPGGAALRLPDGQVLRPGTVPVFTPTRLCLAVRDTLQALEPHTGKALWVREGLAKHAHVFGDDRLLFVVELDPEGRAQSTAAYAVADGAPVKVPDFAARYDNRVRIAGSRILIHETGKEGPALALVDLPTGKEVWRWVFPAKALVFDSLAPDLTGMVEPDGSFRVLVVGTGKEVLKGQMKLDHLRDVKAVYLLADRERIFLATRGPREPSLPGHLASAARASSGFRAIPVDGFIYAYARGGKLLWYNPAEELQLILNDFEVLPVVLFAARQEVRIAGGRLGTRTVTAVKAIHKTRGKHIYDSMVEGTHWYHRLRVDEKAGTVEFAGFPRRILFGSRESLVRPGP